MTWLQYAAAAAIALGLGDILVKVTAGKIPSSLGMLLYGAVPFVTGLIWFITDCARGPLSIRPAGVACGLGVGASYTLVTLGLYAAFNAGAPISTVSPLVRLGGLVVASIAGLLFWREPMTLRYAAGAVLIASGLYLVLAR
jgi:uncharacterized membrane protein